MKGHGMNFVHKRPWLVVRKKKAMGNKTALPPRKDKKCKKRRSKERLYGNEHGKNVYNKKYMTSLGDNGE